MRRWKKVGTVAASALLAAVLAMVAAVVVLPQARGGASLIIETGSMRPTIQPGDLVAVRPVDPALLNIGDIITYATQDNLITHRIIAFEGYGANRMIITQGDANNVEDPPIQPAQVRGVVDYTIPRVGLVLPWLGEHLWWILGTAGAFWLVSWLVETYKKMKVEQAEKKNPTPQPGTELATTSMGPLQEVSLDNIAHTLPSFLGAPSATLVRTRTAITAFSEPIEISSERGEGQHLRPVTVIRTPSLTTAYNEPITVSAATDGNVNLIRSGNIAKAVRVSGVRFSKEEVTVEEIDPIREVNTLNELDAIDVPVEIAA